MNSVKVESAYPDTQYVKMESVYPDTPGVIPSVVTSDGEEEMEDTTVDSGTESCDSKDSGSNRKGERKRPGRKKGQGNGAQQTQNVVSTSMLDVDTTLFYVFMSNGCILLTLV